MRRVIIESPYAGDPTTLPAERRDQVRVNVEYAKACVHDCLIRGEAPIASHLLFTQEGILDDLIPHERQLGIEAGFAWYGVADLIAFYVDRGWSRGMKAARDRAVSMGLNYEERQLNGQHPRQLVRPCSR